MQTQTRFWLVSFGTPNCRVKVTVSVYAPDEPAAVAAARAHLEVLGLQLPVTWEPRVHRCAIG